MLDWTQWAIAFGIAFLLITFLVVIPSYRAQKRAAWHYRKKYEPGRRVKPPTRDESDSPSRHSTPSPRDNPHPSSTPHGDTPDH